MTRPATWFLFLSCIALAGCRDDSGPSTGGDTGDAQDTVGDTIDDLADSSGELNEDADTGIDVRADAADVADVADVPDSADASDVGDGGDAVDAGDTADATDAGDAEDTGDATDTDTGGVVFDPSQVPENPEHFPYGVQAGAMRSDSVLLWTWVESFTSVEVLIWDADTGEIAARRTIARGPDGYTHAAVDGLQAGTFYEYAFALPVSADTWSGRSAVGAFRSALAPGVSEPLLIGATSCTNWSQAPWDAVGRIADRPIDLFIHTGDQVYNDDAVTRAEYRESWIEGLTDPGYLAVHHATGHYTTWDDHEVTNNFDPSTMNQTRLEVARESFFEAMPIEPGPGGGIWNSFRWGDTAEFFVLDCRSERIPDDDIYISREQMDWLKAGLSNSDAHFKIVLNSVPITNMPIWYVSAGDRWEGYDSQRDELLDHITDTPIPNVWFLSGDFHIGMVTRLEPDGPRSNMYEIAVGPGGNIGAGSTLSLLPTPAGQFLFHTTSLQPAVSTWLEFDPEGDRVRVTFEDDGDVLYDEWLSQ